MTEKGKSWFATEVGHRTETQTCPKCDGIGKFPMGLQSPRFSKESFLSTHIAVTVILTTFISVCPIYSEEQSSDITSLLNEMFGSDNWFCFPEDTGMIGVKRMRRGFTVREPLYKVDTSSGERFGGNVVLTDEGATATLMEGVMISEEQCPFWQQESLAQWHSDQQKASSSLASQLDSLFGLCNWKCAPEWDFAVKAELKELTEIRYPIKALDHKNGSKFGIGQRAIPGSGTFWLAGTVDCSYPRRCRVVVGFAVFVLLVVLLLLIVKRRALKRALLALKRALLGRRRGRNSPMPEDEGFDVFLSYNRSDRSTVVELAKALEKRGLRPWLDVWHLPPGVLWQDQVEDVITTIPAAAVLVGRGGRGPWHNVEVRAVLAQFVEREAPAIPVLLPGTPAEPDLPLFLQEFIWVDLRDGLSPEGLDRLVWGITQEKPLPG